MLILDEPTSGLDPVARREFLDMIGRQARAHRRTTLFSSHLIDEVERVADRVGIIHKGKMSYEGDIRTLQETVRRVQIAPPRVIPVLLAPAMGSEITPPVQQTSQPADATEESVGGPGTCPTLDIAAVELPPAATGDLDPSGAVVSSDPSTPFDDSPPGPVVGDETVPPSEIQLEPFLKTGLFRLLKEEFVDGRNSVILSAAPEAWNAYPFPQGVVSSLSLEDIFIAIAGETIVDL